MAEVKLSGEDGLVYYNAEDSIEGAAHVAGTVTIDLTGHDFAVGERIAIAGVVGMTDLNAHFTIDAVLTNSIDVTLTTAQTYVSGGTVRRIIEITAWNIITEGDVCDVTDSGDSTWKEFIPAGFVAFTGGCEGLIATGTKQPAKGSSFTFRLMMDATRYVGGTFMLTSESNTLMVVSPEAVKIAFAFQGTGTLTPVNAGA